MRTRLPLAVLGLLLLLTAPRIQGQSAGGAGASAPPQQPSSSGTPAAPSGSQAGETGANQAQGEQGTPPTFRAGINFVRVDAIVTDSKGNQVLDLKPEDFQVTEDGKPQTVESFKLIKVDTGDTTPPREIRSSFDEESEAQREDVRLFAFFMDDYHVRRGTGMYARRAVANFIRTQLRPSDMICVMYPLTSIGELIMTRDHEAIAKAIERFDGRKYDYVPRNQFEEQYARYPAETVERVRIQVSLSALRGLITHLGSLREGRKAVVLVSEGYSYYLPPQLRDPIASAPGFGNPMRDSPGVEGSGNMSEDRARFFSTSEMAGDLREVFDTANKNNTAIYALDPRGLAGFEHDINEGVGLVTDADDLRTTQDTLFTLANETDGRAITNQNDLEKGLKQVVRDTSVYYLLGYNSTAAPRDGKFHEIKVKVKRPGVQVRHRKGYWALTVEDTSRILNPAPDRPREYESALATIGPRSRTQPDVVRTWYGTSRGANGKTRVTFVWEPIPPPPGTTSPLSARQKPARVTLTAVSGDGSNVYFRGRVPDVSLATTIPVGDSAPPVSQASATASAAAGASRPMEVSFDVPPGPVQLRYQVEDDHATVLDTDSREFSVPDLTAPQVQLSTPEILRARTVKEFRDLSTDPHAVPTPLRDFRRTDRLIVRFDAYAPAGSPNVKARLLNRDGQSMLDVPVSAQASGAGGAYQLDLPLAGMAAAEYILEVTAKAEAGDSKQLVAFRIVS